jgi:GNAT superfamily N-acetyltransferase
MAGADSRQQAAPPGHPARPPVPGPGWLADILDRAAAGNFPAADGGVTIGPQPCARDAGVISFTAHAVIFTEADPHWVAAQLPPGDLSGPLTPAFLHSLEARTGRRAHSTDVLMVAPPAGPSRPGQLLADHRVPAPAPHLQPAADLDHPRLARAFRYRDEVRAWRADGGLVLTGRGVAGRWETAVEVDPGWRGRGLGRALAATARRLVPAGAPVWAQVAPGNAASVRAFLAAGFVPVGAEALLSPGLPE